MNINLIVEPNQPPMTWMDFCASKPPFSMALDGYVADAPHQDLAEGFFNLNHHEGVINWATKSTCAQALSLVRQKFFTYLKKKGCTQLNVYVNDCDQDVCLAYFILNNHHLALSVMNPILNRLVAMNDLIDSSAGAYPFPPELASLQELNWAFEPYTRFRVSGQIDKKQADEFAFVIKNVESRIMRLIVGQGERLKLNSAYKTIHKGAGWVIIKEEGINAKFGAFAEGYDLVVCVRQRPDNHWVYTITKSTEFVFSEMRRLLSLLQGEEDRIDRIELMDIWGGKETVIGSPRVNGSQIPPEKMVQILDDWMYVNASSL